MAGKWPYKRVEEIALRIAIGPFGSSIKVETFTDSGIPIISGQHLREAQVTDGEFNFITVAHADSLKNANVQRGDVIFTHAGNIGQVAFIPDGSAYQRYVISQRQFYLRCNTDLMLPEFITYYFKTPEGQHRLLANANQVGVPSIARPSSYLKTIEVPAPSIEEQQIVVRKIKALDAKIRLNIGINQTLEAMAQAIFKSWFVDFEPVKAKVAAKQEGRDPLRAAMSAISGKPDADLDALLPEQYEQLAATAALFPDEMEESELGEIPKGWAVGRLDDLLVLQRGFDLPNQDRIPGDFQIVAASGPAGSHSEATVRGPSVVTGRSGLLGRVFLILDDFWPLNTTLWVKEFRAATPCYAYELLRGIDFAAFNAGSAVPTLNRNHIHGLPCLIPHADIMGGFEANALNIHKLLKQKTKEAKSLSSLRDTLLPKLLSGELSVTEAMAEAEA